LRIMDSGGNIIADNIDPREYYKHFGEASESWSYLKFPYYKPLGYPNGIYRVGPLARLNICDSIETPLAEKERKLFKQLAPKTESVNNSFYYHYARMIETVFAVEKIEELLHDPSILGTHVRSKAEINRLEGVGFAEAPRGTLFHHYNVNENGVIQKVNMLIATAQNNMAMNRTVKQIAMRFIEGKKITEPILNRIEAGIRCFDPCLSCSTHAVGQMAMELQLLDADGTVLDVRTR
jgi:NAD-reducing hydrogenase large subunit